MEIKTDPAAIAATNAGIQLATGTGKAHSVASSQASQISAFAENTIQLDRVTSFHRNNLGKLATHLEKLPADYQHFDMTYFSTESSTPSARIITCGAVACAVGHGVAAGVRVNRDLDDSWSDYAKRVFTGEQHDDDYDPQQGQYLWLWLFDDDWARYDNTHHGAAARIRFFLAHGVPKRFKSSRFPLKGSYRSDWYTSLMQEFTAAQSPAV